MKQRSIWYFIQGLSFLVSRWFSHTRMSTLDWSDTLRMDFDVISSEIQLYSGPKVSTGGVGHLYLEEVIFEALLLTLLVHLDVGLLHDLFPQLCSTVLMCSDMNWIYTERLSCDKKLTDFCIYNNSNTSRRRRCNDNRNWNICFLLCVINKLSSCVIMT